MSIKNNTAKYSKNRLNFKLTKQQHKEIENNINNVILTEDDWIIINDKIDNCPISDYKRRSDNLFILRNDIIRLIYIMRYKLSLTTLYMFSYLNITSGTFTFKINQLGWNYSPKEAQQLAGKKSRDYFSIRIKGKTTRLNSINFSNVEDKIREYINLELTRKLSKYDVIIGSNNLSILSEHNKEVDIPVIIFKKNKVYKFAIEINGYYWHKNKNENKSELLKQKGYDYITIWQYSSNDKQLNNINNNILEDVNMVIEYIVKKVNNK